MDQAQAFTALLHAHRSIRSYRSDPLPEGLIDRLLEDALHGTSSSGNLNMISVVKTQDTARKAHLCTLHGGQPMVLQAPLLLTICADSFRTREWLALRGARPGFADFLSWHVAGYDAMILAQTVALACESRGLGICYMGTTLHTMGEIAELLQLPPTCLPVTTIVVGHPDEAPPKRDRLPLQALLHDETYQRPDAAQLDQQFAKREVDGWRRYMATPRLKALAEAHGIRSLAEFYTSRVKYDPELFQRDSRALMELLQRAQFVEGQPLEKGD